MNEQSVKKLLLVVPRHNFFVLMALCGRQMVCYVFFQVHYIASAILKCQKQNENKTESRKKTNTNRFCWPSGRRADREVPHCFSATVSSAANSPVSGGGGGRLLISKSGNSSTSELMASSSDVTTCVCLGGRCGGTAVASRAAASCL